MPWYRQWNPPAHRKKRSHVTASPLRDNLDFQLLYTTHVSSKHRQHGQENRAARRRDVAVAGEARSLESLPRADNNDIRKQIIRTTIKNENLLAKKMEASKGRKNSNKKITSSSRHTTKRNSRLEGVLATKIQQSIEKAKYVQKARKSGWDQINSSIVIKNDLHEPISGSGAEQVTANEAEKRAEDEYVKQFFEYAKKAETADFAVEPSKPSGNIFDMLEEADC